MAYTSDSHENTVGRLIESLPEGDALLLLGNGNGDGDFGESNTELELFEDTFCNGII